MVNEPDNGVLDGYVTRDELARELRVHPRTVARYSTQADGLPHLVLGGRVLYRTADVRAFLDRRVKTPNPVRKS